MLSPNLRITIKFHQLHAVSRTQQGRQREPTVKTGVYRPRDENSTPYEAEPGPYIGPNSVLA